MKHGVEVNRADMINAFWAYLSDHAGYTTNFTDRDLLTQQEREQFDVALKDIVSSRIGSRK